MLNILTVEKNCAGGTVLLKLTADRHEASRGLFATAERLVRWQPQQCNFTSGFGLSDVSLLRRPKSISKPNFVEITQYTAEILPAKKTNVRRIRLLSVSISTISPSLICNSLPNFIQIGQKINMTSYQFSRWADVEFALG